MTWQTSIEYDPDLDEPATLDSANQLQRKDHVYLSGNEELVHVSDDEHKDYGDTTSRQHQLSDNSTNVRISSVIG